MFEGIVIGVLSGAILLFAAAPIRSIWKKIQDKRSLKILSRKVGEDRLEVRLVNCGPITRDIAVRTFKKNRRLKGEAKEIETGQAPKIVANIADADLVRVVDRLHKKVLKEWQVANL